MTLADPKQARGVPTATAMLIRGFFAQNVAIGCAFGGFSVSILALEERFQASRAMAEMALAVVVLSMSLLAPLAGAMIVRLGLRTTMTLGVVMSAVGYAALAISPSLAVTLTISGLLIGPGAAMFGSIPASILASGWFPETRGRALGIVNAPLFVALVPLMGIAVIQSWGLAAFYLSMAGLHLLLLPLVIGIREAPVQVEDPDGQMAAPQALRHPFRYVVASSLFWMIVLGDGLLNAANITNSAHIVPIAVEGNISPAAAGLLLAMAGAATIPGSLFAGYLSDRIGAAPTLVLAGLGSAVSWALLVWASWFPGMIVAMLLSGICGAAVFPPTNILLGRVFGLRALPQVLGLVSAFTLPLTFAMSPAIGALHDEIGDYSLISLSLAGVCALVALGFVFVGRKASRAVNMLDDPI